MTLPCGLGGQVKLRWGCVEGRGWVQGGLPVQGSVWGVSPARAPTSSLAGAVQGAGLHTVPGAVHGPWTFC